MSRCSTGPEAGEHGKGKVFRLPSEAVLAAQGAVVALILAAIDTDVLTGGLVDKTQVGIHLRQLGNDRLGRRPCRPEPQGMPIELNAIFISIGDNASQENAVTIVKVTKENVAQKGVIKVGKTGEVFASITES